MWNIGELLISEQEMKREEVRPQGTEEEEDGRYVRVGEKMRNMEENMNESMVLHKGREIGRTLKGNQS